MAENQLINLPKKQNNKNKKIRKPNLLNFRLGTEEDQSTPQYNNQSKNKNQKNLHLLLHAMVEDQLLIKSLRKFNRKNNNNNHQSHLPDMEKDLKRIQLSINKNHRNQKFQLNKPHKIQELTENLMHHLSWKKSKILSYTQLLHLQELQ